MVITEETIEAWDKLGFLQDTTEDVKVKLVTTYENGVSLLIQNSAHKHSIDKLFETLFIPITYRLSKSNMFYDNLDDFKELKSLFESFYTERKEYYENLGLKAINGMMDVESEMIKDFVIEIIIKEKYK